jgi:hypothetical protein
MEEETGTASLQGKRTEREHKMNCRAEVMEKAVEMFGDDLEQGSLNYSSQATSTKAPVCLWNLS